MEQPAVNIRAMTEEERRKGVPVLQQLLNTTGDFLTKCRSMPGNVHDRELLERMRLAFREYNRWLSK